MQGRFPTEEVKDWKVITNIYF